MDFFIPILNTLVIAVCLILLMVGLMSAPWQVLLFILVLGILAYRWLVQRHHLQSVLEDINSEAETGVSAAYSDGVAPMVESSFSQVLHYRGASYTPPVSESVSEDSHSTVEITGQYRGGLRKFLM